MIACFWECGEILKTQTGKQWFERNVRRFQADTVLIEDLLELCTNGWVIPSENVIREDFFVWILETIATKTTE